MEKLDYQEYLTHSQSIVVDNEFVLRTKAFLDF